MDSFKVYLPSNACPLIFPNNTPTDYHTRFDKPIDVEGSWEVGLASIAYAQINDEEEAAYIKYRYMLPPEKIPNVPIIERYPFPYVLNEQGKWAGFVGMGIKEAKSDNINDILNTLNEAGANLVKNHQSPFRFFLNDQDKVVYEGFDPDLTLQIMNKLGTALGFSYVTVFSGKTQVISKYERQQVTLSPEDYFLLYFNTSITKKKTRIYLKREGVCYGGFLKLFPTIGTNT